jgi:NAD+ synthase (glutamine-hydrolysing)
MTCAVHVAFLRRFTQWNSEVEEKKGRLFMNTRSFLDVRAHGCRRVAVCVPRVFLADPSANAEEHARWLGDAWKQGVQYAVCPELGLTGYTCKDLFLSETLRASALDALAKLLKA